jgi:uncharacterized protein YjbI with pentapeptide repeats
MNTATGIYKGHLEILKLGVSEWNKWRVERTNIAPDLKGAVLKGASLAGADLRAANFKGADLRGANLRGANLKAADLRAANLRDAILWSASLTGADLREADLTGADLRGVNFRAANLMNAILVGVATNDYTDFRHATVTGVRLWEDGEPVAEDWEAEAAKAVRAYTSKTVVKIEFIERIGVSDLAAIMSLLDAVFFEYERMFIASLRPEIGELLADACMYRLEKERKQIFRCACYATVFSGMEAAAIPLGFQILGSAGLKDIDDNWKRIILGGTIKKALINRANQAGQELGKLLSAALVRLESVMSFDGVVKAEKQLNRAPNLTIELKIRNSAIEPSALQQTSGRGSPVR